MKPITYKLTVKFSSGRVYEQTGLSLERGLDLKTYFLERVPPAVEAWLTPEKSK